MTASLIPTPVMQFLDADGNPLVGGKVYTYAAGTSTPLATYTDYGGATPNANPVILNSRGEASIWFGTAAYKLELYTAANVLIWTADNVSASTPVVYGTGVAAALAINVGTAGSILVNGGALVGTTLSASGTATMAAINASGLVAMAGAATIGTTLAVTGTTTASAINASGVGTFTSTGEAVKITPTTATGLGLISFNNTGGTSYIGTDNSTASFFGKNNYGIGINAIAGSSINLIIGSTSVLSAVAAGVTIPGTLDVTGEVQQGGSVTHLLSVSTLAYELRGNATGAETVYGNSTGTGKMSVGYLQGNDKGYCIAGAPALVLGASNVGSVEVSSTGLTVNGTILSSGTSATARINPATDNVGYVGEAVSRWQAIYAVNGTIQTSDGREKNAIEDSNLGLSFVQSLRPVSYKWNIGENIVTYDEDKNMVVTPRAGVRLHYGFIAQEVQAAIPEGVDFGGFVQEPDNGTMSLRYHEFIGPMVKAIQELAADFQAYKTSHP